MLKPPTISKPSQLPEFAKMVLGAEAGAGKTHLLGTVKALVFDTEDGSATYRSPAFVNDERTVPPDIVRVSYTPGWNGQQYIKTIEDGFDYIIATKNKDGYELVAVDGITELQALVVESSNAKDPRQAYGEWGKALRGLVLKARLLPVHTIFTSRLQQATDEVTQLEVVRTAVSPSAWSTVSGLFDVIARLELVTQGVMTRRVFDTAATPRFKGKERYGLGRIQDPNLKTMWATIAAAVKAGQS